MDFTQISRLAGLGAVNPEAASTAMNLRRIGSGFSRVLRARRTALLTALALPWFALAEEPTVTTYTFKTFDPATNILQADVHRPPGDQVRPVVVFIHGGALMMGGRSLTPKPGALLEALLSAGYVVVSIDYRLAPQVKLPAVLDDVRDACAWVRQRGP